MIATVVLTVWSSGKPCEIPVKGSCLTIGRGDAVDLFIDDPGLSRLHASINRDHDRVWILDEGSINGSYVNDQRVGARGIPLTDGDDIRMGDQTVIRVRITQPNEMVADESGTVSTGSPRVPLALVSSGIVVVVLILLGARLIRDRDTRARQQNATTAAETERQIDKPPSDPFPTPNASDTSATSVGSALPSAPLPSPAKSPQQYRRMSEPEKMAFVEREATRVSNMIGNRPYAFTEPVLRQIKKYVDDNAGAPDLRPLYDRGTKYAPLIVREFRRHGMHAAVGLYMAWIESLFKPGAQSGVGAGGMFQFMKGTAEIYRLSPEDRFNPEKAAPAAAQYFANLIKRFGSNSISVPLAIAAYNRGEGNIMLDLQKVIDSRNRERSFWNLVEHADSLPTPFQRETISYVPKFFGAAIVGENPSAFGIDMPPLSTYE